MAGDGAPTHRSILGLQNPKLSGGIPVPEGLSLQILKAAAYYLTLIVLMRLEETGHISPVKRE